MRALEQFNLLDQVWHNFVEIKVYYYQIGPFSVCLKFMSDALAQKITRAFEHLKINAIPKPDLTICLWDCSKQEQKLPQLDWELICKNGYQGHYEQSIYLHYYDEIKTLSALNAKKNQAYYVIRDIANLPWWVSGSPLQVIFHAWFREQGMQLTHTAAIANEHNAVLLTGKGGSGKSTTTLSCITEGLYYLGEDYCILKPGAKPHVYSIYQSAKWLPHTRILFPHYEHCIANPDTADTQKALVYYQDLFPTQIKKSAPIVASISLSVGKQTQAIIQKYPPEHALRDLMMSTLRQLPLYHSDSMNFLKNLINSIPNYQLTLSQNMPENVALIKEVLMDKNS